MLSTKSPRLQQQVQDVYKGKDKEVKKRARSEKKSFAEGLAAEAECGELSTVYNITKRLGGNYTKHSASVKGKVGSTIATVREQADICEVLNHTQPDDPADSHQRPMISTSTPDPNTSGSQKRHQSYEEWKSPRHRLSSC